MTGMSDREQLEKEIVSYGVVHHPNLLAISALFYDMVRQV